jgi:hypothetical protein
LIILPGKFGAGETDSNKSITWAGVGFVGKKKRGQVLQSGYLRVRPFIKILVWFFLKSTLSALRTSAKKTEVSNVMSIKPIVQQ